MTAMPGTVPVAFLFRIRSAARFRVAPVPSVLPLFGVADVSETSEMLAVLQ